MGDFAVVTGADLNFLLTVLKNRRANRRLKRQAERKNKPGVSDFDMKDYVKLYISRIFVENALEQFELSLSCYSILD